MTFSRNPSEYTRMIEERNEQYRRLQETKNRLHTDIYRPKSVKEADLREVRALERELGIDGESYNGGISLEV